jgi:hypothetical protein
VVSELSFGYKSLDQRFLSFWLPFSGELESAGWRLS